MRCVRACCFIFDNSFRQRTWGIAVPGFDEGSLQHQEHQRHLHQQQMMLMSRQQHHSNAAGSGAGVYPGSSSSRPHSAPNNGQNASMYVHPRQHRDIRFARVATTVAAMMLMSCPFSHHPAPVFAGTPPANCSWLQRGLQQVLTIRLPCQLT